MALTRQGSLLAAPAKQQRSSLSAQLKNHDVFSLLGPVGSASQQRSENDGTNSPWMEEQRISFDPASSLAVVLVTRAQHCSLRVVHIGDLGRPSSAQSPSFREIRCRPELPPNCSRVSVNSEGVVLVSSPSQLFVCRLPKATLAPLAQSQVYRAERNSYLTRRFELGRYYHLDQDVEILQADWHPLSPLLHVTVLTSDGVLRLYSLARQDGVSFSSRFVQRALGPGEAAEPDAEQEFPLQKLSPVYNPRIQKDRSDGVASVPRFVRFCFGSPLPPAQDGLSPATAAAHWSMFTIFLMQEDGSLCSLCPVVPVGCPIRKSVLSGLTRSTRNYLSLQSERLAAKPNSKLAKTRIRQGQLSLQWLQTVWADVPSRLRADPDQEMVRSTQVAACTWPLDPSSDAIVPMLQGPLPVQSVATDEDPAYVEAANAAPHTFFALQSLRYSAEHPLCLWRLSSGGSPDSPTLLQMMLALNPLGPMTIPAAMLDSGMRVSSIIPALSQHPLLAGLAPFHQILLPAAPLNQDGSVQRGSVRLALDWLHSTTLVVGLGNSAYVVDAAYLHQVIAPLLRKQQPQKLPGLPQAEGLSAHEIEEQLLDTFHGVRPEVFCLELSRRPDGNGCGRGFCWVSGGNLGGLGRLAMSVDERYKAHASPPVSGAAGQLLLQPQELAAGMSLPHGASPGALVALDAGSGLGLSADAPGSLARASAGSGPQREAAEAAPTFAALVQGFLDKYRAVVLRQVAAIQIPADITLEQLELSDPDSFREFVQVAQLFSAVFADLRALNQQITGYLAFMHSVVSWQEKAADTLEQDFIALSENTVTLKNKQKIATQLADAVHSWLSSSIQALTLSQEKLSDAEHEFIKEVDVSGKELELHAPRVEQLRARTSALVQASSGQNLKSAQMGFNSQLDQFGELLSSRHQAISQCVRRIHYVEEKLDQLAAQSQQLLKSRLAAQF